jgi:undecaprenyl diphosphate synthase
MKKQFTQKQQYKNSQNLYTPNHIAIIMDGNRRWAKQNISQLSDGHKKGSENILNVCKYCLEYKVKKLTLYAFSTENWSRDDQEINYLKKLMISYLESDNIKTLIENGIVLKIIGSPEQFGENLYNKIHQVEKHSLNINGENPSMYLNIALNYGSKNEIVLAVNKILAEKNYKQIDEKILSDFLQETQDVDLLIRTGGYCRLSNFLLWQCAYSELYFCDDLWPDFNKKNFDKAIEFFSTQRRNFGS